VQRGRLAQGVASMNAPSRLRPLPTLILGFVVGLFLASLDKILPAQMATGPLRALVVGIDWLAPPLAGVFLGGTLLYAVRHRGLLAAERAATQVLAERLAGTERRQALWVVAAAVAHDLKNPLHNLQLLLEEIETEPHRLEELTPRLRENLSRATDRLSELSRAGRAPEEALGPVRLESALEELRGRLQPLATATRTSLVIECARELSVQADPLALRSAVENVAANALEALQRRGHGGTLSLRARMPEGSNGMVELLVEDDGPGIPERLRERLFTPFTTGSASGTGLGLAIARALARAGGGDLVCSDMTAGHTTFRFTFQGLAGSSLIQFENAAPRSSNEFR
jgi:signal transduction histidine kinase